MRRSRAGEDDRGIPRIPRGQAVPVRAADEAEQEHHGREIGEDEDDFE